MSLRDRPVRFSTLVQERTETVPLDSGERQRMASQAARSVSRRGMPLLTPSSRTVPRRALSRSCSMAPDHLAPLTPMPSGRRMLGPREVYILSTSA